MLKLCALNVLKATRYTSLIVREQGYGGIKNFEGIYGEKFTLDRGGLLTVSNDAGFKVNIFEGSISTLWDFGLTIGKELYMGSPI